MPRIGLDADEWFAVAIPEGNTLKEKLLLVVIIIVRIHLLEEMYGNCLSKIVYAVQRVDLKISITA